MLNKITPRIWNLFVVVCCAALLGFALYNQYVDYLDPCPLCIFQRVVFFCMGAIALLAAIHGPGLNYMLENFPLAEVLSTVLRGSGSCAEVIWSFLGLSMPMWTMIWYVGLGLMTLWVMYRPANR